MPYPLDNVNLETNCWINWFEKDKIKMQESRIFIMQKIRNKKEKLIIKSIRKYQDYGFINL